MQENNKLNIYTLTFQFTRNYGANLQAYALEKYLESSGCNVRIIDYWPPYAEKKFRWNSIFIREPSVKNLFRLLSVLKSNAVFKKFKKKYFKLTKQCRSINDIEKLPHSDIVFVGSDQVWNCLLLGEYNRAYFLDFNTNAIKASYAASAGMDTFSSEELDIFAEYAKKLDYVSVREDTFGKLLIQHGISNTATHLDPVFLLDQDEYRKISHPNKISGPYILIYYTDSDNLTEKLALKLSKMRGGIPIYRVGKQVNLNGIKGIQRLPVEEFLYMIDNAEFIVSRSFHACAFSIIFRKQFYAINAGERSSRLHTLLNCFHLSDRFVGDENVLNSLEVRDISYEDHEAYIKEYTEKAKSYLKEVLIEASRRKNEANNGNR